MNDIIGTNNLRSAPAMFEHPGAWSNLDWRSGMFILTDKKQCTKCGEWKDKSEFYKNATHMDGLYSHCKACHNKYTGKWKQKNPQKVAEERRRHYLKYLDEIRQFFKSERFLRTAKKSREKHKEKINRFHREWKKNNPEKVCEYSQRRRAIKKNAGGKIDVSEWMEVIEKYGNKCLCCGKSDVKITMDHVVPLSKGGKHSIDNVQPLCLICNDKKGTKTIDYRGY